jgi:hypothetical protein
MASMLSVAANVLSIDGFELPPVTNSAFFEGVDAGCTDSSAGVGATIRALSWVSKALKVLARSVDDVFPSPVCFELVPFEAALAAKSCKKLKKRTESMSTLRQQVNAAKKASYGPCLSGKSLPHEYSKKRRCHLYGVAATTLSSRVTVLLSTVPLLTTKVIT